MSHRRLTIGPAADNPAAIACYRKVGFRPVGVLRDYERRDDSGWRDGLLMEVLADDLPPAAVTGPPSSSGARPVGTGSTDASSPFLSVPTVDHLHLHLIARYAGDDADPRGGIRQAIPMPGDWEAIAAGEPSPRRRGSCAAPAGDHLSGS